MQNYAILLPHFPLNLYIFAQYSILVLSSDIIVPNLVSMVRDPDSTWPDELHSSYIDCFDLDYFSKEKLWT